jgi:hypothetical protein
MSRVGMNSLFGGRTGFRVDCSRSARQYIIIYLMVTNTAGPVNK